MSCVAFVMEAHYIWSNGDYSFHCALKDHNLEMLWAINNLPSCLLNETCILLTSESTEINASDEEKKNPPSWSLYLQDNNKPSVLYLSNTCKGSACVCVSVCVCVCFNYYAITIICKWNDAEWWWKWGNGSFALGAVVVLCIFFNPCLGYRKSGL